MGTGALPCAWLAPGRPVATAGSTTAAARFGRSKRRRRRDYDYGSRAVRKGKRSAAHRESEEELEEVGDAVEVTNSSMEPRWPEVEDDVDVQDEDGGDGECTSLPRSIRSSGWTKWTVAVLLGVFSRRGEHGGRSDGDGNGGFTWGEERESAREWGRG